MRISISPLNPRGGATLLITLCWALSILVVLLTAPVPISQSRYLWFILSVMGLGAGAHLFFLLRMALSSYVSESTFGRAELMSCSQLYSHLKNSDNVVWMGTGFLWSGRHSARLYDIMYAANSKLSETETSKGLKISNKNIKENIASAGSLNYLQQLNQSCYEINVPTDQFKGHTLLLATTRAIKTRFLSLLVTQSLFRSPREAIIVIDPKGDMELKNLIEQQAIANGRTQDFQFFHPAFPEQSVCINPLQNFTRPTEIASRLIDLVVKGENEDAFSAFAWRAINVISTGLLYINETPEILSIKKYIDNGVGELLALVLAEHTNKRKKLAKEKKHEILARREANIIDQFLFDSDDKASGKGNHKLQILIRQYQEFSKDQMNPEIDDLIAFYKHDRIHAAKMLASLVPLLSQLSSGTLGEMLSPIKTNRTNVVNFANVLDQNKIIYIGLDSMADSVVGSAIGQILLADLAAVAAKRYNFSQNLSRVNLFIDEAHSVCNKSLMTLANQGAGAGIDLYLASQTLSDFVVALGSEEHALKLLGNLNTMICGRIIDPWTQTLVSERFGKTHIEQMMRSQSESSGSGTGLLDWGSSWGERISMVEMDLVPASVLGRIPNLEYFALLSNGSLIKGKIPVLTGS